MSAYSRRKRAGKVKQKPPAPAQRRSRPTPKPPPAAPDSTRSQAPLLSDGEIRRLEREERHRRYIEGLMRRDVR